MPVPPDPLSAARWYVRNGLSVIPVRADGSKAPALKAGEVEQYRERFPTDDELAGWFAPHKAVGLAIVCGKISGNLAVLDFESDTVWRRWLARVTELNISAAIAPLPVVRTPKGGRHVYCRLADGWAPGMVLARRSAREVLVEVRGQGHYVLAPGCPPACHETNVPYVFESEGWLANGL